MLPHVDRHAVTHTDKSPENIMPLASSTGWEEA